MVEKFYLKLYKIFFWDLKEKFNFNNYIYFKFDFDLRDNIKRMIYGMLINERFSIYYEISIRVISWVIYEGYY